jgi:adenine C2-methylase RlmN of 23S rRNA A2503 and tRNA A37
MVIRCADTVSSPDGTVKFLLQLFDGRLVETVGIPADRDGGGRLTVCVSSQVLCCHTTCHRFCRETCPGSAF